jgi:hypothetical protein
MTRDHAPVKRKHFTPILLDRKSPVPTDIEIAQAVPLKPITQVADELGFGPMSWNYMGRIKPKSSWKC